MKPIRMPAASNHTYQTVEYVMFDVGRRKQKVSLDKIVRRTRYLGTSLTGNM